MVKPALLVDGCQVPGGEFRTVVQPVKDPDNAQTGVAGSLRDTASVETHTAFAGTDDCDSEARFRKCHACPDDVTVSEPR